MDEKELNQGEDMQPKTGSDRETPDPIEAMMAGTTGGNSTEQSLNQETPKLESAEAPREVVLETSPIHNKTDEASQQMYRATQQGSQQTEQQKVYVEVMSTGTAKNGKAIAGMVLGILSIVFLFLIPFISPVLGIIGIILSLQARNELEGAPPQAGRSMATAGFVCSIIGLAFSLILIACVICFAGAFFAEFANEVNNGFYY